MVEFIVELVEGNQVVALLHQERDGRVSKLKPTVASYERCSKFRVKGRAKKLAAIFPNARLAPTFGGYCYGSKSTVSPKQSPINNSSPYRSI